MASSRGRIDIRRPELHRFAEPLTLLLLAGACYVFFFHGLSNIGLLGPDEPRYAAVAREMYQTGDYITPRLHGIPWFEKPVLYYWGAALVFGILGVGEFASRLPSALAATASVFAIYFVCRKLWGRATAVFASLILGSCAGYLAFARAASTDMVLTACLTLALLSFLMGYNGREPERRWWFLAFYAFIGLGVLAKGPVAILLPALSLFGYLVFRGKHDEWKEWHPLYALMVLAVAAPWFVAVIRANGFEFVQVFFINQNFERFTSTVHGHQRPFYFYLPVLLMLTFPWTFMLVPALRRAFDRNDRVLVWFAIVPIVFFSVAGSKLPGYILPSIPPIVMLCARTVLSASSRAFRIAVFIQAGVLLFIGVAFGFFGQMLSIDPHVSGMVIMAVTFSMAAALAVIAIWFKPSTLAVFNATAIAAIVFIATSFILPRFETTDTMRPWKTVLRAIVPDDQIVYLYRPTRWMEYGLQFYRFNNAVDLYAPEEVEAVLKSDSKVLFVADDKGLTEFGEIAGVEIKVMTTVGNQSAFWAWRPANRADASVPALPGLR